MTASFRKTNYSIRPAKHAERRMLCEIFRNLRPFQPVDQYVYVGLGSLWFTEFKLFHRILGIRDMISIERQKDAQARFDKNIPFNAITMRYDATSVVLPTLDWGKRHFIWLDYDDALAPFMLADAAVVAGNANSGSVFAISVQCNAAKQADEDDEDKDVDKAPANVRFLNEFGRDRVPHDLTLADLYGNRFGKLSRTMLYNQIDEVLAARNTGARGGNAMRFLPICDISYADGAKMTTIVGIFCADEDKSKVEECGFANLDFMSRINDGHIKIDVPNLTLREIRHLEKQLPVNGKEIDLDNMPEKDARAFAAFYRYLPNFAVLET